ncbi:MAG: GTPase [Chlorobium sp.]|jgi:hypothetical protein|uniref:GTPase n=1 Tax=Chlorobium sp. TaxID=1095 RepID=UPI0025BEBCCD|nr:GTPase [Chlorobium sp.]MCF8217213.1 GTPase [Chlorobium sp.]MCF8272054.1 GTPase [Chlorobium sp.]MCF8288432.1 GTPase [Chlorobium sp.]MCF8292022.1 GTPase [Chlorobium sp.]MCF8386124.1 GTPase [Chlorobium sp.]
MDMLVFVYNSYSGPVSGLLDIGHKILSPDTYPCSLCNLTHDAFSEKQAWREFRKNVGLPMEFLHRDEFEKQYGRTAVYPVIFRKNGDLRVLMAKEEIDRIENLDDLIIAVRKAVAES